VVAATCWGTSDPRVLRGGAPGNSMLETCESGHGRRRRSLGLFRFAAGRDKILIAKRANLLGFAAGRGIMVGRPHTPFKAPTMHMAPMRHRGTIIRVRVHARRRICKLLL
jgi:hypothetical protein